MAASFVILRCGRRTGSEGQVLELLGEDFTLGRADTCALKTDSDVVSRHHASLQLLDQGWVIADLNSSNGTFVNAKRVETAEVRVGDKLMLGEAGPVYEVIALEGAGGGDLESTRVLRVAERKPLDDSPKEQQEQAPPPPAPKPPPEPEPVSNETESAPLSIEPESDPEPPPLPEASPKPPPAATPPLQKTAPASATATKRLGGFPYGAVAGLGLGVAIGRAWLGENFPYYTELRAPWLGIEKMGVEIPFGWALTVCLAFYYALVGFALQRPVKRFPFLMFLAVCHGAAIYFIRVPSVP